MTSEVPGLENIPLHMRNTVAAYQELDTQMMKLWRPDTDEAAAEAERIAKLLLENADLPLVFRCRACMIIANASTPGYVEWAEEAVRVAKLGMETIRSEGREPGEADKQLLKDCEEVLANAKGDYNELGGYKDEDEEVDEGEGEVGGTEGQESSGEAATAKLEKQ